MFYILQNIPLSKYSNRSLCLFYGILRITQKLASKFQIVVAGSEWCKYKIYNFNYYFIKTSPRNLDSNASSSHNVDVEVVRSFLQPSRASDSQDRLWSESCIGSKGDVKKLKEKQHFNNHVISATPGEVVNLPQHRQE